MYHIIITFSLLLLSVTPVFAGVSDGPGPWADSVVSLEQGTLKNDDAIPEIRSQSESAIGEAESSDLDGTFVSLGFGGSIVLQFDNQFKDGVVIVESTRDNEYYPIETAIVEISADGDNWYSAGSVDQDGEVDYPQDLSCAQFIRITDTSDLSLFFDPEADAYDVDGVRVQGDESCIIDETAEPSSTPEPTPTPSATPETKSISTNSSNKSEEDNVFSNNQCSAEKPGTPNLSGNRLTSSTVELNWNSVDKATDYAISYGTNSNDYLFGAPNTGNTTNYTVGGLDPNTTYYFIVRAVNDCEPGEASNETSVSPQNNSSGQVLGLTTEASSSANRGGRSQVLGLSTDSLADTGTIYDILRLLLGSSVTLVSFYVTNKFT